MAEQRLITRSRRMMELIDDDVLVSIRRFRDQVSRVVALDRAKQMIALGWFVPVDQQIPKILISDDAAERCEGLAEDLLAVCDEQKTGLTAQLLRDAGVIERSDHRLAGAGGCHD